MQRAQPAASACSPLGGEWRRHGAPPHTAAASPPSSSVALPRVANDTVSEFIRSKIREMVKDPETVEKLLPTDHPFGSKRTLIDTDYFDTYNRENVVVVAIVFG